MAALVYFSPNPSRPDIISSYFTENNNKKKHVIYAIRFVQDS